MSKRQSQTSRHHIIGKSLHQEFKVHLPENVLTMNKCRHNALHALFGMLLEPREQLRELKCLYDTILSDHAKELLDELLSLDKDEFYIKKIVKG